MVTFGPLTAEIGWRVWGTPANFNGFRVLASLLHRCRSTEVNQTLHDVWPSPGTICIHFRGLLPQRNFAGCKIEFASKSCVLLYWQRYCTELEQWASAKLCGMEQGRELRNFCSSFAPPVFSGAAITLEIDQHSSSSAVSPLLLTAFTLFWLYPVYAPSLLRSGPLKSIWESPGRKRIFCVFSAFMRM